MLRKDPLPTRSGWVVVLTIALAGIVVTGTSALAYRQWAQLEVTPTAVIRRSAYLLHPLDWGFGPGGFGCGLCSSSNERWGLVGIRTIRCPRSSGVTPL